MTKIWKMARTKARSASLICAIACALVLTFAGTSSAPAQTSASDDARAEFIVAAARGLIPVLIKHLDAGMDPDATSEKGLTALISAVMFDQQAAAKLLLDRGASPDLARNNGRTALMIAVRLDRVQMVGLLLARGASVSMRARDGMTALHFAAQGESAALAASLLEAGAEVDAVDQSGKLTPLILAAGSRQDAAVQIMTELLGAGASAALPAKDGWTPLMAATLRADLVRMKLISDNGADVNAVTDNGRTALVVAAEQGSGAAVAYLLSKKADPNIGGSGYISALGAAVKARSVQAVTSLLEAEAAVDATGPDGKTPLMLAAGYNGLIVADQLITGGADPNQINPKDGTTALMWAANAGARQTVERLLSAGARVGIEAHDGWTAVQAAKDAGHDDIVRLLDQRT